MTNNRDQYPCLRCYPQCGNNIFECDKYKGKYKMTFTKKDKALIKASSLVGYSFSMPYFLEGDAYKNWREGLLKLAAEAKIATEESFEEST